MPDIVRLVYKPLGTYHVYTSPDVKGLHVAADTHAEAQRKAIALVHAIAAELGQEPPVVRFIEIADAA